MKTSKTLVLVMALLAITIVPTAFLGGCSEEQASNPITSVVTPTDNTVNPTDTVEGRQTMQPAAAAVDWNSLSAMAKRQWLLETAYNDYVARQGRTTTYNCKTWAQYIVQKASNYVASLPSTSMPSICPKSDGYAFCSGRVTKILQNQSASYTYFLPGRVLQMWYDGTYKPHTAFIFASSSSGMSWLDCNFVGGAGNGIVGIHYISWADFYRKVPAYTLYEVY